MRLKGFVFFVPSPRPGHPPHRAIMPLDESDGFRSVAVGSGQRIKRIERITALTRLIGSIR